MFSTMKAVINLVILCLMTEVSSDASPEECPLSGFYEELGCTAISGESFFCPKAYKCPDLHPDPEKCYYKGVAYSDREMIPQDKVDNPCSINCYCSVSSSRTDFQCAAVDCVETYDPDLKQQCIFTYEINSCCSSGKVCGKDAIAKLKTCEVDGEIYREGQQFYPKNSVKSCICTADWDGTINNCNYCKHINCGTEIHNQDYLRKKCAPVFPSKSKACPIDFICQSPSTKVIRGVNVVAGAQCVFGNATLAIGDEVTTGDNCTKCFCEVPPFVSCTLNSSC